MGVLDWFRKEAPNYRAVVFPLAAGALTAEADLHYIRVWLTEMTLKDGRKLFDKYTPAVHASVTLTAAGESTAFDSVAGPPAFPGLKRVEGDVVHDRHALTGYLPFRGGDVELGVGLASYRRDDGPTDAIIELLGDLSGLLKLPISKDMLKLAAPIREGIQRLAGAGDKRLHLSFHGTYGGTAAAGGKPLSAGYIAIVRDDLGAGGLAVVDDRLQRDGAGLKGVDAMLLCIEVTETRDDWRAFDGWNEVLEDAIEAASAGEGQTAGRLLRRAKRMVRKSPDLTRPDRARLLAGIDAQFKAETADGLGLAPGDTRTFIERAIAVAPSPAEARNLPDPTGG